jgi:hypothetical protein
LIACFTNQTNALFEGAITPRAFSIRLLEIRESLILGLTHMSSLNPEVPLPLNSSLLSIAHIYAKNLETMRDDPFPIADALIQANKISRVIQALLKLECKNDFKARNLWIHLSKLCSTVETRLDPNLLQLDEKQRHLLRRHLIVAMNSLGYTYHSEDGSHFPCQRYWMGREYRARIESSLGYEYDKINSLWSEGKTKEAKDTISPLFNHGLIKRYTHQIRNFGWCFDHSLHIAEEYREGAPKIKGEVTVNEYLAWTKQLVMLIPSSEDRINALKEYVVLAKEKDDSERFPVLSAKIAQFEQIIQEEEALYLTWLNEMPKPLSEKIITQEPLLFRIQNYILWIFQFFINLFQVK